MKMDKLQRRAAGKAWTFCYLDFGFRTLVAFVSKAEEKVITYLLTYGPANISETFDRSRLESAMMA